MIMQWTIFSLERLCSKSAPKYYTVSLASMSVPLIEEFKADLDLSLGWDPNRKGSVFPKCKESLL